MGTAHDEYLCYVGSSPGGCKAVLSSLTRLASGPGSVHGLDHRCSCHCVTPAITPLKSLYNPLQGLRPQFRNCGRIVLACGESCNMRPYNDIALLHRMLYHMQYLLWYLCRYCLCNILILLSKIAGMYHRFQQLDITIQYCSTISQHDITCDIKNITPVSNSDATSTDSN